jgi:hypothetical protein
MKRIFARVILFVFIAALGAKGQVILSDNYNVSGTGSGFGLNAGVNSAINPPGSSRLSGTISTNLRYIPTITTGAKTNTAFSISSNKLRVASATNPGRFTLSTNGTTFFNFATALGSDTATPQKPVIYDLSISMANSSAGQQRFSFALGTTEGDATTWDFGLQLYRTDETDNFYTIAKRIDTTASGLSSDVNMFITNTAVGTFGSEVNLAMRVTDAGSETTTYNSRVQVSMDGGLSWCYDTDSDPDLPNGWRLNGPGRYIMWDVAPDAGPVTYDNFSIVPVPVSATLISPADGARGISTSASLKVVATNSIPGNVTVTYFGREVGKPYPGPDFLIPVLPDTQNYSDHVGLNGRWYAQSEWIITNRVQKNIAYVAQLGDIVQNGDILSGSPNDTEWEVATNAMYRLENPSRTLLRYGIPYGCCVGNHDQEPNGDPDGTTTHFNKYFGINHFDDKPYYGGHYGTNNDNFFNLFSVGGLDFIVFSFEFDRYGSGVMDWAQSVLATNKNRRVMVMTHHAGSDYTPSNLSASGDAILAGLGSNTNFFLMLGGHVFNGTGWGEGSRSDNVSGHTVRTLISDYQNRPNGGDSLMRLMYFSPSNNTVSIKTYSPFTDTFETDADSQFSFSYNMQLPTGPGTPGTPFTAIGTNVEVVLGSQTNFAWSGLQTNKTYEWYAKVTDPAGNTFISPSRRFTTSVNTAPVVTNQFLAVVGDQPTELTLPAFDANGDPLTFRTNSRPVHGLNSNFDSNVGIITYMPARGYRGPDRFTYSVTDGITNSQVANFDLTVTAPPDANTNGLPNAWEATYGVTDPNGDADGDGQSNLSEYLANTDPTNAASALRILGASQTNGNFNLNWSAVGGTRYRIQYGDSLTGTFTDLVRTIDTEMNTNSYGSASTQTFSDTGSPTNKSRFYRIKVVP